MATTIRIHVDTRAVERYFRNAQKQIPFAIATALNTTARQAADDANRETTSVFTHASAFTQRTFNAPRDLAAKKDSLSATVSARPLQAKYMQFEVSGGTRTPADNTRSASSALVLPGSGKQPLPAGFLKRLSAQAASEVARRQAIKAGTKKRRRGSSDSGIFRMSGHGPAGGPGGFFRRLPNHHLVRLISFEAAATYKPKFDFVASVNRTVKQRVEKNLDAAIRKAIATAR